MLCAAMQGAIAGLARAWWMSQRRMSCRLGGHAAAAAPLLVCCHVIQAILLLLLLLLCYSCPDMAGAPHSCTALMLSWC